MDVWMGWIQSIPFIYSTRWVMSPVNPLPAFLQAFWCCLFLFTCYHLFINPLHPFLYLSYFTFFVQYVRSSPVRCQKYQRCAITMPVEISFEQFFFFFYALQWCQSVSSICHTYSWINPLLLNQHTTLPKEPHIAVKRTINWRARSGFL